MSFTNVSVIQQIRSRVAKTLTDGIQLNMSTDECKKLLKRHVNRKTNVVVMIIDVNRSTEMSLSLQEDRFALMIRTFAQEKDALYIAGHVPSMRTSRRVSISTSAILPILNKENEKENEKRQRRLLRNDY